MYAFSVGEWITVYIGSFVALAIVRWLWDTVAWENRGVGRGVFGGPCYVGYLVHIDMPNATARLSGRGWAERGCSSVMRDDVQWTTPPSLD